MNAVHLIRYLMTYCLPTLTYGLENSVLTEKTKDKTSVLWNNCFHHIFRCCWRESVRPLQYYCRTLPMLHLINQTKLLFWKKMYTNSIVLLYTLSRLPLSQCIQPLYGSCSSVWQALYTRCSSLLKLLNLLSGSLLQRHVISRTPLSCLGPSAHWQIFTTHSEQQNVITLHSLGYCQDTKYQWVYTHTVSHRVLPPCFPMPNSDLTLVHTNIQTKNSIVFNLLSPCVHRSPPNFACAQKTSVPFCTP